MMHSLFEARAFGTEEKQRNTGGEYAYYARKLQPKQRRECRKERKMFVKLSGQLVRHYIVRAEHLVKNHNSSYQ